MRLSLSGELESESFCQMDSARDLPKSARCLAASDRASSSLVAYAFDVFQSKRERDREESKQKEKDTKKKRFKFRMNLPASYYYYYYLTYILLQAGILLLLLTQQNATCQESIELPASASKSEIFLASGDRSGSRKLENEGALQDPSSSLEGFSKLEESASSWPDPASNSPLAGNMINGRRHEPSPEAPIDGRSRDINQEISPNSSSSDASDQGKAKAETDSGDGYRAPEAGQVAPKQRLKQGLRQQQRTDSDRWETQAEQANGYANRGSSISETTTATLTSTATTTTTTTTSDIGKEYRRSALTALSSQPSKLGELSDNPKQPRTSRERIDEQQRPVTAGLTDRSGSRQQEESGLEANYSHLKCRIEKNLYLNFEAYRHYTCANCYKGMPEILFFRKFLTSKKDTQIMHLWDDLAKRKVLLNETELVRASFKQESTYNKWRECCQQAIDCCLQNSVYLPKSSSAANNQDTHSRESSLNNNNNNISDEATPSDKCHATWDGLGCWPDSPAGTLAKHVCPDHVYFLDFVPICKGQVTKQCFPNGSWFIRNDHEWSDYSNCAVLSLYATRLLIGSVWHVVSAIVIGPALKVLGKLPNRGGSKRVRILKNLLFWLLINGLLAAGQKIGIISGFFHAGTNPDDLPPPPPPSSSSSSSSSSAPLPLSSSVLALAARSAVFNSSGALEGQAQAAASSTSGAGLPVRAPRSLGVDVGLLDSWSRQWDNAEANLAGCQDCDLDNSNTKTNAQNVVEGANQDNKVSRSQVNPEANKLAQASWRRRRPPSVTDLGQGRRQPNLGQLDIKSISRGRLKRSTAGAQLRLRKRQSPPVVFLCWTVSVGIKITRLLGYAWMFTGAVYLCSVLLFAPAEPPTLFIKWLMFLTNAFPVVIGFVYVIARTIYEPSPLTLIVKLPYYHMIGDNKYVEYLWSTQLDCWMLQSKYDDIEEIADRPNLILIFLNGVLFVVTIIIMCRIARPGSTRQEMSLGDYFKAAGTLVLLYGAHYALIVYRPPVEGCIKGQVMYYLFLFVDGIQGVAVSYVFCYRTSEGREIIAKWWLNQRRIIPRWCRLMCCCCCCCRSANKEMVAISAPPGGYQAKKKYSRDRGSLDTASRFSQSMRSNITVCNGKDMATELININDTPRAGQLSSTAQNS